MSDFETALEDFINAVNEDGEAYFKENYSNLEWPGVYIEGGRKYIKLCRERSVYCFVAAEDVPKKNVKRGDILKAASWSAPALKRKHPAAANIFNPESYEAAQKARTGWLYA